MLQLISGRTRLVASHNPVAAVNDLSRLAKDPGISSFQPHSKVCISLFLKGAPPVLFVPALSVCPVNCEVMRIVGLADTVVGLLGLELDPIAEDREYVVLALAHPSKIGFVVMIDPIHLDIAVFAPESCDEVAKQFIRMMQSNNVRADFHAINLQDHPGVYAALLPVMEMEEQEIVWACRYLTGEAVFDSICD